MSELSTLSPAPASSSLASLHLPPTILFGAGACETVAEQAVRLGGGRALLVTDEHLAREGPPDRVRALLTGAGVAVDVFSQVQPDPTDVNVSMGLDELRRVAADIVVAVGGGSVIDAAKMIAVLAGNPGPVGRYAGYHRIPAPGLPLIAVPTTAGTGSEATRVAVVTDGATRTKLMILDRHLVPSVAIVDPSLSATMPPSLTAHVGVDTLTHGIEAYVSLLASPLTDPLALSTVALAAEHLETAVADPADARARAGMALAACHGGIAFSNASVCLVHGMSRPLGAIYHVPHGLSNAVLLPTVTRFSLYGAPGRYAEIARTMGCAAIGEEDGRAGEKLVRSLARLNQSLGIAPLRHVVRVSEAEFEASLPKMAEDALASGSPARNPVAPSHSEIVELYREAW